MDYESLVSAGIEATAELTRWRWKLGWLSALAYSRFGVKQKDYAAAVGSSEQSISEYKCMWEFYQSDDPVRQNEIETLKDNDYLRWSHFRTAKRYAMRNYSTPETQLIHALGFLTRIIKNDWCPDKAAGEAGDSTISLKKVWDSTTAPYSGDDLITDVEHQIKHLVQQGKPVVVRVYERIERVTA